MNDKRTQREALEQTVRFFETVINISNDGILITDFSGVVIRVNRSLAAIFDQSVEDMLETSFLPWLKRFDAHGPEIWAALQNRIHREKSVHRFEYGVGKRFFEINGARIQSGGTSQTVLWVWRDVTLQKQADEALKRRTGQLEEANATLKDFAYIVSHDLKAPLRGISNLAGWLATDYADAIDHKGMELIDLLLSRVQRMNNMINGILQYSKIGRAREEEERVDINTLIGDAVDFVGVPDPFKVIIECPLPTVKCEKMHLDQVFRNLIDNAVKYMDKTHGEIRIACKDEGAHWRFSVSDNGPGIDKNYHEKIFRIFQTLAPRDQLESTGIGLTMVKKIVEGRGGKIRLESEMGKGSTFFFTWEKRI